MENLRLFSCTRCRKACEPEWNFCIYCGLQLRSKKTRERAKKTGKLLPIKPCLITSDFSLYKPVKFVKRPRITLDSKSRPANKCKALDKIDLESDDGQNRLISLLSLLEIENAKHIEKFQRLVSNEEKPRLSDIGAKFCYLESVPTIADQYAAYYQNNYEQSATTPEKGTTSEDSIDSSYYWGAISDNGHDETGFGLLWEQNVSKVLFRLIIFSPFSIIIYYYM